MLETHSKNRPSNKFNDKLRHKDSGLTLHARQINRRERHTMRRELRGELREQQFELKLERIIDTLCREAGVV